MRQRQDETFMEHFIRRYARPPAILPKTMNFPAYMFHGRIRLYTFPCLICTDLTVSSKEIPFSFFNKEMRELNGVGFIKFKGCAQQSDELWTETKSNENGCFFFLLLQRKICITIYIFYATSNDIYALFRYYHNPT